MPGNVIEEYEILEKVGGNMALVFKARHRLLDKVVALKLVPVESMADPARLARFDREMRMMGQIEHPNLVTAADARSLESWHLVAMEWIEGGDLHQFIRHNGPLPVTVGCEIARQAALGLHYAHQHGLIHRDIKPSNLMLTRAGVIKVIDLGLALITEDTAAQLTEPGMVLGTLAYCAPEQARDSSKVDLRADIYSLGCTLYYLVTGKAPYGDRKTAVEILQAHTTEPFPRLAAAQPDAPPGLEAVLERMTAKDPDSRFASSSEVAAALEPFARGADLKPLLPPANRQSPPHQLIPANPPPAPDGRRAVRATELQRTPAFSRKVALLLFAIMGAALLFLECRRHDVEAKPYDPFAEGWPIPPHKLVIFMMDTTADNGIYDTNNVGTGGSNAKEVSKVLQEKLRLPMSCLHQENVGEDWNRESFIISQRPHLVIIHRSLFFHPANAVKKFGKSPEFANSSDDPQWRALYNEMDERFIEFMAYIEAKVPWTQFLVYSRGTDPDWLKEGFQADWKAKIESRFPELQDRIFTMTIPGKKQGTFRDTETRNELIRRVKAILRLPDKETNAPGVNVTNPAVQAR